MRNLFEVNIFRAKSEEEKEKEKNKGGTFRSDAWEIIRDEVREKRLVDETGGIIEKNEEVETFWGFEKGSSLIEAFKKYEELLSNDFDKNSTEIMEMYKSGLQFNTEGTLASIRKGSRAATFYDKAIRLCGDNNFALDENSINRGDFYVFEQREGVPINIPQIPDSYHDEDDFKQAV